MLLTRPPWVFLAVAVALGVAVTDGLAVGVVAGAGGGVTGCAGGSADAGMPNAEAGAQLSRSGLGGIGPGASTPEP